MLPDLLQNCGNYLQTGDELPVEFCTYLLPNFIHLKCLFSALQQREIFQVLIQFQQLQAFMNGVAVTQEILPVLGCMLEKRYLYHLEHLTQFFFDLGCKRYTLTAIETVQYVWRVLVVFVQRQTLQNLLDFGCRNLSHVGNPLFFDFKQNSVINLGWYLGRFFSLYLTDPIQSHKVSYVDWTIP